MNSALSLTPDPKAAKVLKAVSDHLIESEAEKTILRFDNARLQEALSAALARKKRKKTVVETIRAEQGSGAVIWGPAEIQRARDLTRAREEETVQKQQDIRLRKQQQAQKKIQEEVERQQRRDARAAATEARKEQDAKKRETAAAVKLAKQAQRQAQIATQLAHRKLKARQRKQRTPRPPPTTTAVAQVEEVVQQRNSRGGRVLKIPARLRT